VKFLADESVDGPIVARLRQDGHDVLYVAELAPGISDPEVLELANREAAPLLTADKDFGHLIFRQQRLAVGIVLIRLSDLPSEHRSPIVAAAIQEHAHEIQGAFTVIGPLVTRICGLTL
jgi:predicted nuclease of predicted toxin-antitoxin system